MFCPNAIDWGNVADWVSGAGAFAAVVTALHIAGSERRSATKAREIASNEAHERRAQVIAEAIRLAGEVEAIARSYVQLVSFGGGEGQSKRRDLLDDIDGVRRQLDALQQFPNSDPRLFAEIGRTASDCRTEAEVIDMSTSYAAQIMTRLAEHMAHRRDALITLSRLAEPQG
ncbi:hypothetical protein GCM10023232_06960 [Sphingosinicella ginsenosidimutans]|uniref:Uncharacterized protein n=1 Tax=Allosphingosinicella ginsenosidimutans TaxID=1176539 RepID=A0A5C6TWI1_9SPHN|nr:hypothetical protein [Sphingosinicella ginsenosidimutans]TXC64530.1 hypothetical protein FRZ32_13235 [Sphingosinicella ginsenosidimutans]